MTDLTAEIVREFLDYDDDSGDLRWKRRNANAEEYERNWRSLAAKAGVMIRVDREAMR